MATKHKTPTAQDLRAIRRVLVLLDGYMSTENQDALLAWDGGMMTWRELRQHAKAAIKLLPKPTSRLSGTVAGSP